LGVPLKNFRYNFFAARQKYINTYLCACKAIINTLFKVPAKVHKKASVLKNTEAFLIFS